MVRVVEGSPQFESWSPCHSCWYTKTLSRWKTPWSKRSNPVFPVKVSTKPPGWADGTLGADVVVGATVVVVGWVVVGAAVVAGALVVVGAATVVVGAATVVVGAATVVVG